MLLSHSTVSYLFSDKSSVAESVSFIFKLMKILLCGGLDLIELYDVNERVCCLAH